MQKFKKVIKRTSQKALVSFNTRLTAVNTISYTGNLTLELMF